MNIYDKAHELAKLLKNSPEVVDYKKRVELLKANETNKKIVEDLRKKNLKFIQNKCKECKYQRKKWMQ